jgi:hypothetical protein
MFFCAIGSNKWLSANGGTRKSTSSQQGARKSSTFRFAYPLASKETLEREFGALSYLPDNHPKMVLSMDPIDTENPDGICWMNVIGFLMGVG